MPDPQPTNREILEMLASISAKLDTLEKRVEATVPAAPPVKAHLTRDKAKKGGRG